ncbi:MAG: histidine kinase [Coriobacteriia bacterium]|nr:histidine kinase [Coriobacteriia bacterium]
MPQRRILFDWLAMIAALLLGGFVVGGPSAGAPQAAVAIAAVILAAVAAGAVFGRMASRPDHIKAVQSQQLLDIANESLAYMRQGLSPATAQEVCRLALRETEAAAVAITDRDTVLGFAGLGQDHHTVGGPIITRATHEAIDTGEHRILATREEIGCPKRDCVLKAAIVVPLETRGLPVGTLKFYYTTPRLLNETQVTMVEGLARLLSTQLGLAELDRQTALACRMELKALQSQINPHFLFNTINTIASLIRTDPPRARELLREFATFYRRTLENSEELIPLSQELDYVRRYLVFERARFGEERIRFTEEVPADTLALLVPAFVLQPIVENAVQHGIRPTGPLRITLRAAREGGTVRLTVRDDGRGISPHDLPRVLDPGFGRGLGIALKNVDDRLKGHFGPDSGITVTSVEGEGTTVTLVLDPAPALEGTTT